MALAKVSLDDVDLMQELANERPEGDIDGYETDYLQLGRGPFRGLVETFRASDSMFAPASGVGADEPALPWDRAVLNASYQHYGARIRLRGNSPADRSCFWILLPSSGPVQWRSAALPVGTLIELPPSSELDLVAEGIDVVTFSFRNEVRDAMFRAAGHRSAGGAVALPPRAAARLGRVLRGYLGSLRSGADIPAFDLRIQEQLTSLLAESPACLNPRVSSAERRRATRRAESYLHDHLHRVVPAHELAEVAGVPLRTLQDGFRREFGVSPHAFHGLLRMQAARRRLKAASAESTRVSFVALEFGFAHFGRFAGQYGRLFRESPVATLRRGHA